MPQTYKTRSGDVLDEICWRVYGDESRFIDVLAANSALAELGPILPAGIDIVLPDLPAKQTIKTVSLWD